MRNEAIQKRLLVEDKITVQRALELAQGMEAADRNAKELKSSTGNGPTPSSAINDTIGSLTKGVRRSCYQCGRSHHEKECKAPVCRSKEKHHSYQVSTATPRKTTSNNKAKLGNPHQSGRIKPTGYNEWTTVNQQSEVSDDEML